MIEYFEKPITKKASEMKPGDVYITAYGGYEDNIVKAAFERCYPHPLYKDCICTDFHSPEGCSKGEKDIMCYNCPIDEVEYEVIGVEK